ncbi:MAG: YncE family protein, partial [bacterium]
MLYGALGSLGMGCAKPFSARVEARWRIGLGADALAVSADRLAVACSRSNDVWLLGLPEGDFIARVDTRPRPRALLFDPRGRGLYVAADLTSVALLSVDGRRVLDDYSQPLPISGFSVDPSSGRLFCAQSGLPLLGVYSGTDFHRETSLSVGGEV